MSTTALERPVKADVYRNSVVVDGMCVMKISDEAIDKSIEAGVTAIHVQSVGVGDELSPALKSLGTFRQAIDDHSDNVMLAATAEDVRRAKKAGRLAFIFGMQSPKPIGADIAYLRTLYDLGVRIIGITHNTQNYWGTGCVEAALDGGLTAFGRRAIAEMNRLGITVDIAHAGPKTALDAIECSEVPVLCTHSNPKTVVDNPRNKSDELIRKLAARNGVIGINAWAPANYRGNGQRPTLDDMLDCFDHVLKLVGPDHVSFAGDLIEGYYANYAEWQTDVGPSNTELTTQMGSWYGFDSQYVTGLESESQIPSIANGLLARGHKAAAVSKILGENFLRVFGEATG